MRRLVARPNVHGGHPQQMGRDNVVGQPGLAPPAHELPSANPDQPDEEVLRVDDRRVGTLRAADQKRPRSRVHARRAEERGRPLGRRGCPRRAVLRRGDGLGAGGDLVQAGQERADVVVDPPDRGDGLARRDYSVPVERPLQRVAEARGQARPEREDRRGRLAIAVAVEVGRSAESVPVGLHLILSFEFVNLGWGARHAQESPLGLSSTTSCFVAVVVHLNHRVAE